MDYSTVNTRVFRKYLDVAMPACASSSYVDDMKYGEESFDENVTVAEEAFAIIVMENNYKRWCHIAAGREGQTPKAKWMKQVSQASEKGRNASGKWTDEGMERFNDIVNMVQEKRDCRARSDYMAGVKRLYENEAERERIRKKRRKEMNDDDNGNSNKKKRVRVKNLFRG